MIFEPFLLEPVLVEKPWGGRALGEFGKHIPDDVTIGESWEVADLPAAAAPSLVRTRSTVATGPHTGATLRDLIDLDRSGFLGSVAPTPEGDFPLLVKLLDAAQNLSVQVHPHAEYVRLHQESRLKTESWYVVTAQAGAQLYIDLAPGSDTGALRSAIAHGTVPSVLRSIPATAGDFHHLPAGTVHALGAGVVVAEVQTPSDTTFRIYDWTTEYGREPRTLHIDDAFATLVTGHRDQVSSTRPRGAGSRHLVSTDHYELTEHRIDQQLDVGLSETVRVFMVIGGSIETTWFEAGPGSTFIVPPGVTCAVEPHDPAIILEAQPGARI